MTAHRRLCTVVALVVLITAIGAGAARAASGTYTQMLCSDPDTGNGVGANGILPSGLVVDAYGNPSYLGPPISCGPGPMNAFRGIDMSSGTTFTSRTRGWGIGALVYTPAPGTKVVEDDLYMVADMVSLDAHETLTVHGGSWLQMFDAPNAYDCEWAGSNPCVSFGTPADLYNASNRIDWTQPPPDGFSITMGCDIPDSTWVCTAEGQQIHFYGAKIVLRDESNPIASGAATGGITTDDPLRGSEDVTVSGTDAGGGLYRVLLLVDSRLSQAQLIDTDGGSCTDVNPLNSDPYEFAVTAPCKPSAGGTFHFDMAAVPVGRHNVKVQLEDAAGNATTVVDRTVMIGDPVAGVSGTGTPQSVTGPSSPAVPAGQAAVPVPNGVNGSASAVLSMSRRLVRIAYGQSVTVRGRLRTATGAPITGAKLDVLLGGHSTRGSQVTTGGDGAFRFVVPPGPSRIVRFGYRANVGDTKFARAVTVRVHVRAGLTFRLSRSRLHNGQTLVYFGTLLGPGNGGRIVDVEVRNAGSWQVICSLRTSRRGGYRCGHHFTRTFQPTSYAFRAVVPSQAGLPYDPNHSRIRKVHVSP